MKLGEAREATLAHLNVLFQKKGELTKILKGEQPAGSGNGTDVVDDDEDPATDDEA